MKLFFIKLLLLPMLFSWQSYPSPVNAPPANEHVLRERWAMLDTSALWDKRGEPVAAILRLNFFQDTVPIGGVVSIEQNGDSVSWYGVLRNIENGYFFITFTSGVYMFHAAAPAGIYEATFFGGKYRIMQLQFLENE